MMISPEAYYEEYLRNRSPEEILREIRSLKREISRLKRELEDESLEQKAQIMPSPLTQIKCSREYLEMAKQAYEEAGGQYELTKAEQKDRTFNDALSYMKRFTFEIGGFFDGYEKRIYTVSGEKVFFDLKHSLHLKPSNLPVSELFTRDEFLQRIAECHIGEWKKEYVNSRVLDGTQWSIEIEYEDSRKPVRIYGSNAFPYNFDDLRVFLEIDEEETEEE